RRSYAERAPARGTRAAGAPRARRTPETPKPTRASGNVCAFGDLLVERTEGRLFGPARRAGDEARRGELVALVDRDHCGRIAHRPKGGGARPARRFEHLATAASALMGERAGERARRDSQQDHAPPQVRRRRGNWEPLEPTRLFERAIAVALECEQQRVEEEPVLERCLPRRAAGGG